MASTQAQLALQMVAQLRLLDPSMSAEVGTPERKIIDTLAQALYDDQVDLSALSTGLDVDSKYGAQLDRFLTLFGFKRQRATFATGFVTFSRPAASTTDIRIPAGSTVRASNAVSDNDVSVGTEVRFQTTFDVVLPAGSTSIIAPIQATVAGTIGNVAADQIKEIVNTTIYGITQVTNNQATSNGFDIESDAEYKTRFKNTVFRNLAGTQDQYLALAIATAFSTRANVIGPLSHYREYIQVPWVADDASYPIDGVTPQPGGGVAGEYTTALSSIPYAKYIWNQNDPFLSNGEIGATTVFYRPDADFRTNLGSGRDVGDTHRLLLSGIGKDPANGIWPNITLKNVYTGSSGSVTAVRPGDIALFEFDYLSDASRNDATLNITNAVDVYVDGQNSTIASTVTVRPTSATAFIDNPNSKYHYENYRRVGEPGKRPVIGNVFMPLFWQPTLTIPDQIIVGTNTYLLNVHYWPIRDVSELEGTVRARDGIEWSTTAFGKRDTDSIGNVSTYTGPIITDPTGDPIGGQPIEIENYTYDRNIIDLQAALDGSKQITTDVLAHHSTSRYFKLDISVMYNSGYNIPAVNNQIRDSVDSFLRSLYFGSTVQLSDLLQVVHNVSGVDNVRWSSDTPNSSDLIRTWETDVDGTPLTSTSIERVQAGTAARPEIQALFIGGEPTGTFTLSANSLTSSDINVSSGTLATDIQTAINGFGIGTVAVIEDVRTTSDIRFPLRSFRIVWATNGQREQVRTLDTLTGGPFIYNSDFFLRDNELAQLAEGAFAPLSGTPDTVPGLIIRPRAQNTFNVR